MMMMTSLTESSPKTPIAESTPHLSELRSRSFSFENSDEKGKNSSPALIKPHPGFVLGKLSALGISPLRKKERGI